MKKIAILTSGGDAPGMNACLRASVRYAIAKGAEVFGVEHGYQGLIDGNIIPLDSRSVSDIIQRGGTFLKTARSEEFATADGMDRAFDSVSAFGITDIIAIGGDGTFHGAKDFSDRYPINMIGIPGTIDNDLAYTDFTLGFDTAVNTVLWAMNNLRDTMGSHDRVSLLEVMGRHCGDIALYAGICGGAEHILVPEIPYDVDEIAKQIRKSQKRGKKSIMMIFAEGAGNRDEVCKQIAEKTGVRITVTHLGHVQRGGGPTMFDRLFAAKTAAHAVDIIVEGKVKNRVVGIRKNEIIDVDITEALNMKRSFDRNLYETAKILGL